MKLKPCELPKESSLSRIWQHPEHDVKRRTLCIRRKTEMKDKNLKVKKEIAITIGYGIIGFYHNKITKDVNKKQTDEEVRKTLSDAEKEAYDTLSYIGVSDILIKKHWFKKDEIIVVCKSPGYLIGKKGELINYITTYFQNMSGLIPELKEYSKCSIGVIENKWIHCLYDFRYWDSIY